MNSKPLGTTVINISGCTGEATIYNGRYDCILNYNGTMARAQVLRLATDNDIKCGVTLHMQNETDIEAGIFEWGSIESSDVPRLKKEISKGHNLWWLKPGDVSG